VVLEVFKFHNRKGREDVGIIVYESRQELMSVFYAFGGFLVKTTDCYSFHIVSFSLSYLLLKASEPRLAHTG
jgi:hypothetical protein